MIPQDKRQALELFSEGRKLYKLMKFAEAREAFALALTACPTDGPSKEYLRRCDEYIKTPPPEEWDGIYEMKTK